VWDSGDRSEWIMLRGGSRFSMSNAYTAHDGIARHDDLRSRVQARRSVSRLAATPRRFAALE
jgi:hypothetical protein